MNKKISVIVPIYNGELYLARCIDSIINSTKTVLDLTNIEILLINDGSTDSTLQICNEYKTKFPSCIKVFNRKNSGVAKTRNYGISVSTGQYMLFFDSDDYCELDYIKTLYNEIVQDDKVIVSCGYKRIDSGGNIIKVVKINSKYQKQTAWAGIYLTSFIKEHKIEFSNFKIGEDLPFSTDCILLCEKSKYKVISQTGYIYFYNEKSVSNSQQKKNEADFFFELNLSMDYYLDRYNNKPFRSLLDLDSFFLFAKTVIFCAIFFNLSSKQFFKFINKYTAVLRHNYPEIYKNPSLLFYKKEKRLVVKLIVGFYILLTKAHLTNLLFLLRFISSENRKRKY